MPIAINGTGTVTGLSVGGLPDGSVAQADLATNVGSTGPVFRAGRSTNQTGIASGTLTKFQANVEDFDIGGFYDAVTNFRFQPTIAGYYQINGSLYISGANITLYIMALKKNGTDFLQVFHTVPATSDHKLAGSDIVYLNGTTDYVELWGSGTNGSTVSFMAASALSGCLVRAA